MQKILLFYTFFIFCSFHFVAQSLRFCKTAPYMPRHPLTPLQWQAAGCTSPHDRCGYRGILAIEYFVRDGAFYFNEMAPRPHNSGHYTIEGCTTNQFRELARYLLGQPLEEPRLLGPTVMKNVLGRDLEAARQLAAEGLPGVHVHLYGKREARPLRKMGHVTFTDTTAEAYAERWASRFVR